MSVSAVKFDQNWLAEILHDNHITIMANHDPSFVVECMRLPVTLPIPEAEADELFQRLSKRFRAWTGKPLKR